MKYKMQKLGLCMGLLLSGCQVVDSIVPENQEKDQLVLDFQGKDTCYSYYLYLDIPSEEKSKIDDWISRQDIEKRVHYTYFQEVGYNYEVNYQDIDIMFYAHIVDTDRLTREQKKSFENTERYLYKIVFTSTYKQEVTEALIQEVMNQITRTMSSYSFYDTIDEFYQAINPEEVAYTKVLKKESPKDVIKNNLQKDYNGENKKAKKKDFSINGLKNKMFKSTKSTIISIIVILFVMGIVMVLPSVSQSNAKNEEEKAQDEKVNKKITTIYRDYVDGNKQKAHQKMFAIDYNKVPNKKDKKVYLEWLVEDEKYTKALDLNKEVAYTIGEKINDKNVDQLKKINSNDNYKVLSFFIADHDDDFQTMIEMQNSVDLKRKNVANKLVQSYILTNQKSELDDLVDKIEKEKDTSSKEYKNLNTAKQYYEEQNTELQDLRKDRDEAKDEVKDLQKKVDKSKKSEKKDKEKELDKSREKLDSAEERYNKAYNDVLNTNVDDAIPNEN